MPQIIDQAFGNGRIRWRDLQKVKSNSMFSESDWSKIFPDLTSYADVNRFLAKDYGQCLVARSLLSMTDFAFAFLYIEGEKKISFHGGGWEKGNAWMHYDAVVSLLNKLFEMGYKIRTSCLRDNRTTYRFLMSLGFINHYTSQNFYYFWLPYRRFINSAIYKRFNS